MIYGIQGTLIILFDSPVVFVPDAGVTAKSGRSVPELERFFDVICT